MKKITYWILNAIRWRLNRLVQNLDKTYEEQVLDELGRRKDKINGSIQFYDWTVYSHNVDLIYAGISSQFIRQVNDFYTSKADPMILDCGANIGMSVLRYKRLYPMAKIIAFEPDPTIFGSLKKNIADNELKDVELVQAAVWTTQDELEFMSDEYDGGFLSTQQSNSEPHSNTSRISVPSIDLRDYLCQPIDFLKMDIEGAEHEVLIHCADLLYQVEKIIVEVHYRIDEVSVMIKILEILENAGFNVSILSPLERNAKAIDLREPFVRNPKMNADIYIALYGWKSDKY